MASARRAKSDSEFVASTRVALRDLHLPESWLERKIRENPTILELGNVKIVSFQRKYKKGGRADLILLDEESSILYCAELMLDEVDESHIVRCVEYWLTETRKPSNKDWFVVAVLAAESIRKSRYFPVIEFLSQKLPLTVLEVAALKVAGHTTLTFTRFFDGQDQIDQVEGGDEESGRIDVDKKYWANKRPAEIIRTAESLARIFRSPSKQLRVTYLQGFWGFALGEKPKNFVTIAPKQKFVNVRVRITDTKGWSERLRKAPFEITGGTPGRSVRFRVTDHHIGKRGKLLRQLAEEAYSERVPGD